MLKKMIQHSIANKEYPTLKDHAKKLLAEADEIKGPGELENWNIKAGTLLAFMYIQDFCNG